MYIAVDFDGTIVKHEYPKIGEDVGAFPWLKLWQEKGAKLLLWTIRDRGEFTKAVAHTISNGVKFYGYNDNPDQKDWSNSRKMYANIYVDDAAYGCPLIYPEDGSRPYVDWGIVGPDILAKIK